MAYNTVALKTDVNSKPIPQYYNTATGAYEVAQGENGSIRVVIYDDAGNEISVSNPLQVNIASITAGNTIVGQVKITNGTVNLMLDADGAVGVRNKNKLQEYTSSSSNKDTLYQSTMRNFTFINDSESNITVQVESFTFVVKPGEWLDEDMDFTHMVVTASTAYRLWVRG